ncbi:MAG: hypothetical protein JO202_01680 [Ktedonobacteraceae bacterium]|nr:hypothetical protein [Ktedonobacteraceae bacterium]
MTHHCAWCGDPGDANGSHGICPKHKAGQWARFLAHKADSQDRWQRRYTILRTVFWTIRSFLA